MNNQVSRNDNVANGNFVVIPDVATLIQAISQFDTPAKIEQLEAELLQLGSIFIPVKHSFCKGVYARQITIPAATIAIGHSHSEECLNIVTCGSVSVIIDGKIQLVQAPACFVSPGGDRKIGYVHEDLTWITVHPSDKSDIKELEDRIIVKSEAFKAYESKNSDACTSLAVCRMDEFLNDRVDYFKALADIGVNHDTARTQSEATGDQIDFPAGSGDRVFVGSSRIEGNGLFCAFGVDGASTLCPSRLHGKRTPAGRYTNHSRHPNCEFYCDSNGDIFLRSFCQINAGDELTVDYRKAVSVAKEADKISKLNTI